MSGTVVHIFHLLLYLNLDAATGGLAAGAIAGIVIVAVVFALLLLMIIAVIIWHKRSHAKNESSMNILHENNHTTVGDLQAECHQAERSQSYAQSLDAVRLLCLKRRKQHAGKANLTRYVNSYSTSQQVKHQSTLNHFCILMILNMPTLKISLIPPPQKICRKFLDS